MRTFKAKDGIGRTWEVSLEAVKADYVEAIMDMDNLSRDKAQEYVNQHEDKEFDCWWYEQILPYPDLIQEIGKMVEDISPEQKQEILERLSLRETSYEEEV